ncbi:MAG TPA: pantetheine-phosphate adenylyltransferase [Solirubrobacterales bacterium]|nr:pantetheine-phosphate adenylyltransferase [Solirubrobacterales bacterium]
MTPSHQRVAVYPGTFDPLTNGHLDVIRRATSAFDKVVVGIVRKPHRKLEPMFSAEDRCAFVRDATHDLAGVEAQIFSCLVVAFARECGARTIIKGMRAISDFERELEMAQLNRHLDPGIESVYVIAAPEYSFLSSTGVKEVASLGADVSDLVPPSVAAALRPPSPR